MFLDPPPILTHVAQLAPAVFEALRDRLPPQIPLPPAPALPTLPPL